MPGTVEKGDIAHVDSVPCYGVMLKDNSTSKTDPAKLVAKLLSISLASEASQ